MNGAIVPMVPFKRPVPIPTDFGVGTDFICIDDAWTPYIQGALRVLTFASTWDSTDAAALVNIIERAHTLIGSFEGGVCSLSDFIQFRQVGCTVQVSFDGGTTWTTIFDGLAGDCAAPYPILGPTDGARNTVTAVGNDVDAFRIFVHRSARGVLINQSFASGGSFPLAGALEITALTGPCIRLVNDTVGRSNALIEYGNADLIDTFGRYLMQLATPVPGSNTRGALFIADDDVEGDAPFYVRMKHDFTFDIKPLIGPAGATGAAGAGITSAAVDMLGPTDAATAVLTNSPDVQHQLLTLGIPQAPEIDNATANTLSPGSSATASLSVETGGNKLLTLGIPTGATGATGAAGAQGVVNFPDLPAPGAAAVNFDMLIPSSGADLPWLLPPGYTVQIVSAKGFWVLWNSTDRYDTDIDGTADVTLGNGFFLGKILGQFIQISTAKHELSQGSQLDAQSAQASPQSSIYRLAANTTEVYASQGYVIATVVVTPSGTDFIGWARTYVLQSDNTTFVFSDVFAMFANTPIAMPAGVAIPSLGNDHSVGIQMYSDFGHTTPTCQKFVSKTGTWVDHLSRTDAATWYDCPSHTLQFPFPANNTDTWNSIELFGQGDLSGVSLQFAAP